MGKLTDAQIRQIIQKASLLQKFNEGSSSYNPEDSSRGTDQLFEITDDLGIPRKFVHEAYIESIGVPVQEPLVIDNNDFNSTEVVGFAHGHIDSELFNELQAQIEYHFNTRGKVTHRRNKVIWKAKPVGPSKFIASINSPKVEFEQLDGNTKIRITQSLKTTNKLYLPAIAATFGGLLLFGGATFGEFGNDVAPPMIVSLFIFAGAFLYSRFVNGRKSKKKKNLQELTETLQGKMERHSKAIATPPENEANSGEIEIPEDDYEDEDSGIPSRAKQKE